MLSHFGVPVHHFGEKDVTANATANSAEGLLANPEIQSVALTEVLRLFDGRVKAVRRSSGGLVAAEPCQIVVVTTSHPTKTNIRLRVRFKDITVEEVEGELVSKCQTHTKVISLEELREPFSYNFNNSQQFVLDVGHGIVPVHVVHYDTDPEGTTFAYFVENAAVENAVYAPSGETRLVQTYRVPRAVLRHAGLKPEREGKSDYEIAQENYARMERLGALMFPDCMKSGNPIAVPTGASVQDIRDYLQLTLVQSRAEDAGNQPLFMSAYKTDEEDELNIDRL